MNKIISIINQKGGSGKTTTVVNIGAFLAKKNKKVLIIDLDPQADSTKHLGFIPGKLNLSIYDVLSNSKSLSSIIQKCNENLFLAPANISLAEAEISLVNKLCREQTLKKSFRHIKDEYDYILIDCPPSLGLLTINALVACQDIIIPIESEYFALDGTKQLISTIELIRNNLYYDLNILGYVLVKFDTRNKIDKIILKEVKNLAGKKFFKTIIRTNIKLVESSQKGMPICLYAPTSNGAEDYNNLSEEIIERII